MAKEPDQTRWVGIRPTDPSEDIPTTTRQLAPAIGDLQAIKENLANGFTNDNADCTVSKTLGFSTVPAGVLWVITHMIMYDETSMCDMIMNVTIDGTLRSVKQFNSYEPKIYGSWNGSLVLKEDDSLSFEWLLGGANDVIRAFWHGYKIGEY